MILDSLRVKNYRSILDEELKLEQLTALVGANGSGKSSFLKAFESFYNLSPKLEVEDFYDGDISRDIEVAITFKDLSNEEKELFSSYMQGEFLRVERVFNWVEGGKTVAKYHGAALQCPDFISVREGLEVKDRGNTAKAAYAAIRAKPEYSSLPAWPSSLKNVPEILKQWEADNPNKCIRTRDDGQFFGFKEVAQGYLGRFTRFLFIPAVRDASDDASEGRGSALTDLMDLVVRSVLANRETVKQLREETQKQYQEIMDPSKLTELSTLADHLTETLKTFVPDAGIDLSWLPLEDVDIPMPKADVKLVEDGYPSAVMRTGHGLQRAFILTMLQHLTIAQPSADKSGVQINREEIEEEIRMPNLVLAIEEPELYQHPSRQRHFAKILLSLANKKTPGVAENTQIIYSTHSPLFVGIDRIDQVRVLRKETDQPGKPKITRVVSTNLDEVAEAVWRADGEPSTKYSRDTLLPRLRTIMTPWMSEGFFSDVVVLVEGEDDRAAILGVAKAMGYDLESLGYAVIPCGGKTNIDRPAIMFSKLDIPVYIIWDGDKDEKEPKPEQNHRLLRLLGEEVDDWPCGIYDKYACFEKNLETTLRDEIGESVFDLCFDECQMEFCIPKKKHAMKNPSVIEALIQKASKQSCDSQTMKQIVAKMVDLKL